MTRTVGQVMGDMEIMGATMGEDMEAVMVAVAMGVAMVAMAATMVVVAMEAATGAMEVAMGAGIETMVMEGTIDPPTAILVVDMEALEGMVGMVVGMEVMDVTDMTKQCEDLLL